MNKKTIMKAKEQYDIIITSKRELEEARELLKKQDISIEEFKKCLAIINREESNLPSEDAIINYCFHGAIDADSECNIYVFRGAYKIKNKKNNKQVVEVFDYSKADYFVYFNLEKMLTGVVIHPQEFKEFEKENIILRFSDNDNFNDKFESIQCAYYKEFLNNPDISLNKVLEKLKENL